jgi:hypothetical protein
MIAIILWIIVAGVVWYGLVAMPNKDKKDAEFWNTPLKDPPKRLKTRSEIIKELNETGKH